MSKRQSTRFFLFCSVAGAMMLSMTASATEPTDGARAARAAAARMAAHEMSTTVHALQGDAAAPAPVADKCRKPKLLSRSRVTAEEIGNTAEAMQSYVDCMRPVLDAQRKEAEAKFADAKASAEASNAMATEVNTLVEEFKKWAAEHKDDGRE